MLKAILYSFHICGYTKCGNAVCGRQHGIQCKQQWQTGSLAVNTGPVLWLHNEVDVSVDDEYRLKAMSLSHHHHSDDAEQC